MLGKQNLYVARTNAPLIGVEPLFAILGHSDISTTTIYINLANIDRENGMKSFKVSFNNFTAINHLKIIF